MPTLLPRTVREAWGEEVAEDFSRWLEDALQQRTVHRDEYREVLSRLDVLEERFDHVEERFDLMEERFDKRFEKVDERFQQMTDQLDRMNDRILSMTRWLIGLLLVFGTMFTALLAVAQFTT